MLFEKCHKENNSYVCSQGSYLKYKKFSENGNFSKIFRKYFLFAILNCSYMWTLFDYSHDFQKNLANFLTYSKFCTFWKKFLKKSEGSMHVDAPACKSLEY